MRTTFSSDCPYNCNNGKLFNPALKQMVDCPHCSKIRSQEVREDKVNDSEQSLCKLLNVRKSLTGLQFSMEAILPEYARSFLLPITVDAVGRVLEKLTNEIILGEKPECSYLFNLGAKANIDAFVYQYLIKAYKSGVSVLPYLYASQIHKLRLKDDYYNPDIDTSSEDELSYTDLINKDICVVLIDAGATYKEIKSVAGLMQLRAREGLSTLIFTLSYSREIFDLVHTSDEKLQYLAKLVSVEYLNDDVAAMQRGGNNRSNVTKMTSEQFDNMFANRDML